ncbi:MAG: glutamate 5-kinase [bacterium]
MSEVRDSLTRVKKVVVKVGSALLSDPEHGLDRQKIAAYCRQIVQLRRQQIEVILVSSGAVAAGCHKLGWARRPEAVHQLQAAAAVGQMGLAQAYESALSEHGHATAMIMLTHDDLADRERYLNARATLSQLLQLNVVPVINENDTVATDEIRFGDNDTLAALVTNLVEADLLVILTDVDGLMSADPRVDPGAERIAQSRAQAQTLDALASAGGGAMGRGGMLTKLSAARLAARSGANTVIASGRRPDVLLQVLSGADVGTLLTADMTPLTARKRWLAGQLRARGDLELDAGAARAVTEQGVSLLAIGVVRVSGSFLRGDLVRMLDSKGTVIAQGLTNYSSDEVKRLAGAHSEAFGQRIEYVGEPELVHRDNLVVV